VGSAAAGEGDGDGGQPDAAAELTEAQRNAWARRRAEAVENFAALQALIEAEFAHVDERLGQLTPGCRGPDGGASAECARLVLAKRSAGGGYEVRERAIVAELIERHTTLAALLGMAAEACRTDFEDAKTADYLQRLAEHHEKDAGTLRALLREG